MAQPIAPPPGYQLDQPASPAPSGPPPPPGYQLDPKPSAAPTPVQTGANLKPLPALRGDIGSLIDQYAQAAGIPPSVFRAQAALETGGNPHPERAISAGGAEGVMQFEPGTWKIYGGGGDVFNAEQNIAGGAKYMRALHKMYGNWTLAAGAYNMGPGDFNRFLEGDTKGISPQKIAETKRYMAYVAAAQDPHALPVPVDRDNRNSTANDVSTRHPTQKHSNLDVTKAHHGILEEIIGHQDLPWIWANATRMDQVMNPGKHTAWDDAWALYMKDPAAAYDKYGLDSPFMLGWYAKNGNPQEKAEAQWYLSNPKISGWMTMAQEFFNPMSLVEGGLMGRIAGPLAKAGMFKILGQEKGRALMAAFSPFNAIVKRWGNNFRNIIAQAGGKTQQYAQDVEAAYIKFFGNKTAQEQRDVVHMSQGQAPENPENIKHAATARDLRHWIIRNSLQAVKNKALIAEGHGPGFMESGPHSQVYDPATFFPMHGASDNPMYMMPETTDLIDQARGRTAASSGLKMVDPKRRRLYATLREFQQNAKLKDDWLPAEAFRKHYTVQGGSTAFIQMMLKLAEKYPQAVRPGAQAWLRDTAPIATGETQGPAQHFMSTTLEGRPLSEMVPFESAFGDTHNPYLKDLLVSPDLQQWFARRGATIKGMPDEIDGWHKFNSIMRGLIMYNPQYHPFWNIARNAGPAGESEEPFVGGAKAMAGWIGGFVNVLAHQLVGMSEVASKLLGADSPEAAAIREQQMGKFTWRPDGDLAEWRHPPPGDVRGEELFRRQQTAEPGPMDSFYQRAGHHQAVPTEYEGQGDVELRRYATAKHAAYVEDSSGYIGPAYLRSVLKPAEFKELSNAMVGTPEEMRAMLEKYGVPEETIQHVLSRAADNIGAMDAVAAEIAKQHGHDALYSSTEFFALHPDAVGSHPSRPPLAGAGNVIAHAGKVLESAITRGAAKYAADVADAAAAGVHANYGMGSTFMDAKNVAGTRTLPYVKGTDWLSTMSKWLGKDGTKHNWDKAATTISDWNRKLTFGPHGEAIFSTKLLKKFMERGMNEEDAVWAVREALGNYQNVDPNSWQSKFLFFYPWLKTDLPFWMKTFLTKPRYITAPAVAMQRQREEAGDPNVESARFSEPANRMYLGQDQDENLYYSIPIVDGNLEHVLSALDPNSAMESKVTSLMSLGTGRAVPLASEVYDTAMTAAEKAGAMPGTYRGYEVMWNTNAPEGIKLQEWLQSTAGKMFPMPFPYLGRQMIKDGIHWDRTAEYVAELASAGTFSRSQSEELARLQHNADRRLKNERGKLETIQASARPLGTTEYHARINKMWAQRQEADARIRARIKAASGVDLNKVDQRRDEQAAPSAPPGYILDRPGAPPPPPPGYSVSP